MFGICYEILSLRSGTFLGLSRLTSLSIFPQSEKSRGMSFENRGGSDVRDDDKDQGNDMFFFFSEHP